LAISRASDTAVLQTTFTLTGGDFVRGLLVHSKWTIRLISGVPAGLGVLLTIGMMLPPRDGVPRHPPVDAVVEFFAIAFGYPVLLAIVTIFRFCGIREQARTMTWSFFPDHIECVAASSQATMKWEGFVRVRETRSAFLLCPQRSLLSIVP